MERCWVVSAGVKNPEGLAIGDGGVPIFANDLSAVEDTGGLDVHVLSRLDRDSRMTRSQFFRAGVGICLLARDGRVLALERYDLPGAWQLPQGGLDEGEEPADAARRELYEETGLRWDSVRLLGEHPRWLAYELEPGMRLADTGRGQVQRWFVVRLIDPDSDIYLGRVDARKGRPEFRAYEWMGLAELVDRAAPFRRPVYVELLNYVESLPRD